MYQIKGIKTFKGHEGEPCAQGSLYNPAGKKAAEWSDDSWGGPMRIDFVNDTEEEAFVAWAKEHFLPTQKDYDGNPHDVSTMSDYDVIETSVANMSYAAQELATVTKAAKKGIAYYLADPKQRDGKSLWTTNAPYTPENVAALRKQYPNLLEIVNEKLGLPFVDGGAYAKAEENKRFRKLCKSTVLFTLREAGGAVKTMQSKQPYSTAVATMLRAKYPNLVEIINERYL